MESHVFVSRGGPPAEAIGVLILVLVGVAIAAVCLVVKAIVYWKIFAKTGYSGALGLLMLIPVVDVIMAFVLAFGQWPVLRELEHLKGWHRGAPAAPATPPPRP